MGATDACESALGMCAAKVSVAFAVRLYDLCEGPAEHLYLSEPYDALTAEIVKSSLAATVIAPLSWQKLGAVCFRVSQHINLLEAHAVMSGGLSVVRLPIAELPSLSIQG